MLKFQNYPIRPPVANHIVSRAVSCLAPRYGVFMEIKFIWEIIFDTAQRCIEDFNNNNNMTPMFCIEEIQI